MGAGSLRLAILDANGSVSFAFVPSRKVGVGQRVTATATDAVRVNTSEFSAPRTVARP